MNEVRLETERMVLRTYRLGDFEDHFKLCADPDVMRYLIGGKPLSRFEAWRHMAFLVGHWELLGYGYFASEEKATGRFIGRIGYTNKEKRMSRARPCWFMGSTIRSGRNRPDGLSSAATR